MKFLIAGLGSIGRRHMRNLVALGEGDILLYRTGRSTLPEKDLEGFPVVRDLQQALEQGPDALIVANPTALHLETALAAAERGIHLLLEKPVSHTRAGVEKLERAVREQQVKTLVGFQFRYHPGLLRLRELLRSGELGKPRFAHAVYGEYLPGMHPWEDYRRSYAALPELGGGVTLTLCHPFDYLRWLFGEVRSVWGSTAVVEELLPGVESVADAGLEFSSGMTATVHLDYLQRPADHHLEVVCDQGTLRWENSTGELKVYRPAEERWEQFPPPPGFERNHLFLAEMSDFLGLLSGKNPSPCPLEDGVRVLDIVLAVQRSAAEGRRVAL